jgi:hypothetical protein
MHSLLWSPDRIRLGAIITPNGALSDKPERTSEGYGGHCQSKFVYFAKTSEPDFAAIDFPAFFGSI